MELVGEALGEVVENVQGFKVGGFILYKKVTIKWAISLRPTVLYE